MCSLVRNLRADLAIPGLLLMHLLFCWPTSYC
jgi:hypothetical protein